jgi:hypothetical protein
LGGGTQDVKAGEGTIAVSSLRVLLRDADGKVLYNASGGIQVLQQLSIKNQFTGDADPAAMGRECGTVPDGEGARVARASSFADIHRRALLGEGA